MLWFGIVQRQGKLILPLVKIIRGIWDNQEAKCLWFNGYYTLVFFLKVYAYHQQQWIQQTWASTYPPDNPARSQLSHILWLAATFECLLLHMSADLPQFQCMWLLLFHEHWALAAGSTVEQKERSLLKKLSNSRRCLQGQMHFLTHTLHPSVIRGL